MSDNQVSSRESHKPTKYFQQNGWTTLPAKVTVNNMYYVKVHKTGSTTLQNIISRYGFRNNLSLVPFDCTYGMTFPNPPYPQYILEHSLHKSFNIVAEHSRFDPEVYKSYMAKGTMVISQLRHPMKFFASLFGFEYLYERFHLAKGGDPIRYFLENPNRYDQYAKWEAGSKICGPRQQPSVTKNSMAYHLGYTETNVTIQSVEDFLSALDKHLSFVIITEKFDESMILLKQLFSWNISDILYLPRGSLAFNDRLRFEVGKNDSDKAYLINLHKHWSPVDYILYDHFHKRLVTTLSKQTQLFWEEVEYFKTIQEKVKDFCANMCHSVNKIFRFSNVTEARHALVSHSLQINGTKWNPEFRVTYLDCVQMMLVTEDYQFAVRAKEAPAYCNEKSTAELNVGFNKQFCIEENQLVFNFPWVYIKNRLFASYGMCMKYVNG